MNAYSMKPLIRMLFVGTLAAFGAASEAGGLLSTLPPDGSWVSYDWAYTEREGDTTHSGTLKVSSVGTVIKDDASHRWIELKIVYREGNTDHALLMKALVPESKIGKDHNIGEQERAKLWMRIDDDTPVGVISPGEAPQWLHVVNSAFHHWFDPMKQTGSLPKKAFKFQQGDVEAEGFTEEWRNEPTKVTRNEIETTLSSKVTRELWVNDRVPTGGVACKIVEELLIGDDVDRRSTVEVSLIDFGENATSEIPNHN